MLQEKLKKFYIKTLPMRQLRNTVGHGTSGCGSTYVKFYNSIVAGKIIDF